ncbi:hypothetical protein [Acinetobacter indicus]|uniref:hypothetical protein n=1 Tax=Acinetobacter indicus TaxID=756892 RepID=UPI00144452D2|nr:hypothetical protein [Acinetobacter indicus]
MYTFSVEDELADIVKAAAEKENRTARGQFRHFLITALKNEGLYYQKQSESNTKSITEEAKA